HDKASSLGARFEMWKGASSMFIERPITGWGTIGYNQRMIEYAEMGLVDEYATRFSHAHNEFLDMAAKRGMAGLLAILALYLIPIRLFSQYVAHTDPSLRSISMAGVLLGVMYFDFGLSQVFLAHNSGVMIYAFLLPVLWVVFRDREGVVAANDNLK
ncbi:O-antigen ligase family protein, partial [Streptomyces heliomycini]